MLQSRAVDEKGNVQPTRAAWLAKYAPPARYHNHIDPDLGNRGRREHRQCVRLRAWLQESARPPLLAACATTDSGSPVPTTGPGLGRAATAQEIAAWDISIPPSGAGLPAGSGIGETGRGSVRREVPGVPRTERRRKAGRPARRRRRLAGLGQGGRTVGSFWPYATTLFDYMRRAMPTTKPQSLTNDEVYAVTAYLLYLNGIVAEDAVMNAQTLPQVKMPNRDGFVDWSRR